MGDDLVGLDGLWFDENVSDREAARMVERHLRAIRRMRVDEYARSGYAGVEWLIKELDVRRISDLGSKVAKVLGFTFLDIWRFPESTAILRRIDWANPNQITMHLPCNLSTYGPADLTRLVYMAHRLAVRVEISPSTPARIKLDFFERDRDYRGRAYHPKFQTAAREMDAYVREAEVKLDG